MSYKTQSDDFLCLQLKKSDQEAFTEIFNRHEQLLYRHAYKWLQDRDSVKDAIQEVFTIIWDKREQITFKNNLSGYLYISLRNCILKQIKLNQRNAGYLSSLENHIAIGDCITDHRIREKQLTFIIEQEITALPPKMRTVFELSRKQHLSHSQIADRLGISELTVKTQVKNALRLLRSKLGLILCLCTISNLFKAFTNFISNSLF